MSDSDDATREIESRIQHKQNDLRNDIDALEDKLSPENLKAQARERADQAKEQVKERAVDMTRQAGETVRQKIDDASRRFRTNDKMEMPSMSLLGLAAVIGIGLLLIRKSRDRGGSDSFTRHAEPDFIGSSELPPARPRAYERY